MYQQGYNAALQRLGLEKIAFRIPKWVVRTGPKLKEMGSDLATMTVGSPKKFMQELRSGTALGPKGLIRESFKAPALWQKALFYGFPAVSAVQTLRSNDPDKAESLGGLAGGMLLGTAAMGPFGMLGSYPLGFLGEHLGSRLVRGAKRMTGIGSQNQLPYTSREMPVADPINKRSLYGPEPR